MDGAGSLSAPQVQLGERRVELRRADVGSDVVRRASVLGHEQPGSE